jgi:hypothetical protein
LVDKYLIGGVNATHTLARRDQTSQKDSFRTRTGYLTDINKPIDPYGYIILLGATHGDFKSLELFILFVFSLMFNISNFALVCFNSLVSVDGVPLRNELLFKIFFIE